VALGCGTLGCTRDPGIVAEYLAFPAHNVSHARPQDPVRLTEEFQRVMEADSPDPPEPGAVSLGQEIADRLNLGFLLDQVDALAVETRVLKSVERDGFREDHLEFVDQQVGRLQALYLVPTAPRALGPLPAVLGLHGHDQDQAVFARDHMGYDLARAGFVVMVPTLRVMDCSTAENRTALHLVRSGFWLMGLRLYETLLVLDHLRQRPEVDPARIGVLSHSGGSSAAALLVRLTDRLAAQVTDYQTDYRDTCGMTRPWEWAGIHCETIPPLFSLSPLIHDETTLAIPRLVVPYGFSSTEDQAQVLSFFQTNLQANLQANSQDAPAP
jgi:hypothetical protein